MINLFDLLNILISIGSLRKRSSPPLPNEPSILESVGVFGGGSIAVVASFCFAAYLYQLRIENYVMKTPAAQAIITSASRKQTGNDRFTDARLDFERPTPTGSVVCHDAPIRFSSWSNTFAVGEMVEVHPQRGSCYRPFYAPDLPHSRPTLLSSIIFFAPGIAAFAAGLSSYRRRLRTLA